MTRPNLWIDRLFTKKDKLRLRAIVAEQRLKVTENSKEFWKSTARGKAAALDTITEEVQRLTDENDYFRKEVKRARAELAASEHAHQETNERYERTLELWRNAETELRQSQSEAKSLNDNLAICIKERQAAEKVRNEAIEDRTETNVLFGQLVDKHAELRAELAQAADDNRELGRKVEKWIMEATKQNAEMRNWKTRAKAAELAIADLEVDYKHEFDEDNYGGTE